jgi:hypothetical protein
MLPTAKQFNKKYLEALKNIRLQLVQTSFLPNFLSNQVKSIHPLSFEGKFPPCNHAPLAYKRVHSLAAEFKNIRTNPTQLSVLFIVKLVRKVNSMETGVNLIIDIYIYIYIYILPVSTASASFVFQCFAMFSESGSSGFGALRSAWMLSNPTLEN